MQDQLTQDKSDELGPIQRPLNLQLQRWRCSRQVRFLQSKNKYFCFKTHLAISGVVIFTALAFLTHDRKICTQVVYDSNHLLGKQALLHRAM
jgi:hypothetical protein